MSDPVDDRGAASDASLPRPTVTPPPFVELVEKRLIGLRNIWIEEGQK
jgi:hypothetical protein